jgi:hypothetical protein
VAGAGTESRSAEQKVKQRAQILTDGKVTKNGTATYRYFGIAL